MNEPPKNRKFGLLKCSFAVREEIIRNMEFMDAFHFSTLSKRSKRLVHDAKLRAQSISFHFYMYTSDDLDDLIRVITKDRQRLTISLSNSTFPPKRDSNSLDGLKLANLINEPSEDYRKKLSAHLLFIFPFEETSVYIERRFEPLTEFFLWDVRKTFDLVQVGWYSLLLFSSEDLKFLLETIKSNRCYLGIKIDDPNFKYRKALDCKKLFVRRDVQWLDRDGILQRNPKMKKLRLQNLRGEQINDLLKQWIHGQVTDLESLVGYKRYDYPADVILDGLVTMDSTITREQAKKVYSRREVNGQLMDIQRKIDGQLATVLLNQEECFAIMWNEERLAELGN